MRVKVTHDNIVAYGLDIITGNKIVDLLAAADRAEELGEEMFVVIPDVEGGDTEAPTERNAFEHFSEMPEPDGRMHEQESVNLTNPTCAECGEPILPGQGMHKANHPSPFSSMPSHWLDDGKTRHLDCRMKQHKKGKPSDD